MIFDFLVIYQGFWSMFYLKVSLSPKPHMIPCLFGLFRSFLEVSEKVSSCILRHRVKTVLSAVQCCSEKRSKFCLKRRDSATLRPVENFAEAQYV